MKSIILSIIAVVSTLFLSNAVLSDDENYETSNLEKLCQKSLQNSQCKNSNFVSLDQINEEELDCQLIPSLLFVKFNKCKILVRDKQLIVYIEKEEKTTESFGGKNIKRVNISIDDIFVFNSQWWIADADFLFKKVENSFGLFGDIQIGFIDRSQGKHSTLSKFLTISPPKGKNISKVLEKVESWLYYLPDHSTFQQQFNDNKLDRSHNSIVNQRAIKRLLETNECPYCDLRNANLVNADLDGANLEGAILSGANLEKANLKNAYLVNAQLDNANLFQANLEEAKLTFASLAGATLAESNLKIANLQYADLEGADLSKSNLDGQKFKVTSLNNANLDNAKLNEATLKCVNLQSASLKNTKLVEANLSNCTKRGGNSINARLNRANISKLDYLPEGILTSLSSTVGPLVSLLLAGDDKFSLSSNLSGANLNGANLIGTNLTGVNLTDANLSNANLDSTELKDANLSNTNMIEANISDAKFENSNLCDAIMPDLSISEQGCIQDKQDSKPNEKSEAEEESKAEED